MRNLLRFFPTAVVCLVAAGAQARTATLGGKPFLALKQVRGERYDVTVALERVGNPSVPLSVVFAYGPRGYYRATFGRTSTTLARVLGSKRTVLARTPAHFPKRPGRLTLRLLEDEIVLMADGVVACRALDSTFRSGWVLLAAGAGVRPKGPVEVERHEPIFFTDDFMVTQDEEQTKRGWDALVGTWQFKTTRPESVAKSESYYSRSANAFAYLGTPPRYDAFALTVRGESWWNNYVLRAAVNGRGPGGVGIAFGCRDERNFWLIRLECRGRFALPSRLQLVRVEGGRRRVVAETYVRARTRHWYSLAAEVYHGRVRVRFLGSTVMDVSDARITGGLIGLYADGKEGAVFDDVEVNALGRLRFDRAEDVARFGKQVSGSWRVRKRGGGAPAELEPGGEECTILFGNPAWSGGAVTAEVRPGGRGTFGLVAGADDTAAYLLALRPEGRGALILRRDGIERTLETFRYPGRRGEWCKVALNLSDPAVVAAYVGGGLVARVKVNKPPRGRVGLFARGARGVAFRGLVANRSPRLLAEHQIGNAIFLADAYMSSWATETGQWIPDDGPDKARSMSGYRFGGHDVFWRKGDYYGDYTMVLPLTLRKQPPAGPDGARPPAVHHPISGSLAVHFGLRSGDLWSGYSVAAAAREPGRYDVTLRRRKQVVATARDVRTGDGRHEVLIYNSGRYVWARVGDRELFSYRKPDPGEGTRIAAVRKGEVDFERLAVHAENLDDSSFERAPTAWKIIGDWGVTKRFRCDPRWSWMGVDSLRGHAALWHRREFPGDVTVELYASMRMRAGQPYYCPSDLNLTISADAERVDRGYTFIVGGWDNTRTVLLRNGKVVASTTKRYLPDTRDRYPSSALLHRRWFYIKVRRKGARLQLFCDNQLYLEWTDPDLLPGGKVAVWTQEQSIMVSRLLVYYRRCVRPSPTTGPPRQPPPAPPTPLRLSCKGRAGYFFDFETGTQGWAAPVPAGGARAEWDTDTAAGGRASLRLSNAECPGRFIARVPIAKVNLLACPVLSFDYRIPPGVQVNLYFDVGPATATRRRRFRRWRRRWPRAVRRRHTIAARTYFIVLTGPETSTEGVKRAGRFPGARADGRWRTARVNIARLMRRFYPTHAALWARNFRFGLDVRRDYAVSGIGGNPPGAAWNIDNFLLVSAAVGTPTVRWKPYPGRHAGYAACVTGRGDSDPGGAPNQAAAYVRPRATGAGLRFVHVRPVVGDGSMVPPAHFPLFDAGPDIEVAGIAPADRSRWGGEPIRIRFAPSQVAALDAGAFRATLGEAEANLDGAALRMDWKRGVLTLDPSHLPVTFDDGAVVNGSLTFSAFGRSSPKTIRWQYVASRKYDRTPPGPVHVEGQFEFDDFERGRENWRTGDFAVCGLDDTTAASGRRSLRIYSKGFGGTFLVYRHLSGRRIGECPLIEFDYKIPPNVRADLVLRGYGYQTFRFTDRSGRYQVGTVPGVKADDKWHHAVVDLFPALWNRNRFALSSRFSFVGFGDLGWPSAREGDAYNIDNVRIVPVASCRDGLELKVSANDPLGVAGYVFSWSDRPDDEPPKKILATGDTIRTERLPEGRVYLHIRAVDRAGNWGPTRHFAYLIDNTPPRVVRISPRPGSRMSPHRFAVVVKDAYGPDPAALRLTVGGKTYTLRSASLAAAYRPSISWDLTRTPEEIQVIPNGETLKFSLRGVRDFAGNTAEPITGTWTMDYRRDRVPPQRVEIDLASAPVAFVQRYDRNTEGVRPHGRTRVDRFLATDAASHVLRYGPTHATTQGAIFSHKPFDLARTGLLKVDVKLPKRTMYLDLFVTGAGFRCKLRMGDPPPAAHAPKVGSTDRDGFVYLGPMNNVRGRPGWHTQWADLYALVRKAFPKLRSYSVTRLAVGRRCRPYAGRQYAYFDNLVVYGCGKPVLKATLRSRDVTGLSGYAVEFSSKYVGDPERRVNHKGDALTRKLGRGTWYIKVLARDNNGNWSRLPGLVPYVIR